MSPFPHLLQLCGLSQEEAASFFDVSVDTIKSWSNGRRRASPEVIGELSGLWANIQAIANALAKEIREMLKTAKEPSSLTIEIGLAWAQRDARHMGLPTQSAHAAAIALAVTKLPRGIEVSLELVAAGGLGAKLLTRA